MLLNGKVAIVYGGAGAIGGAMARAFAREGATVHLAGRTAATLETVADEIRAAGGVAETAELDAFDEAAVRAHVEAVVAGGGRLDVSVNVIWHPDHFGTPVTEMRYEDFEEDVTRRLRTMWITASAAVPTMSKQGSGVILTFGGYGHPMDKLGGFQVGLGAIESLRRTLASELGAQGIRVITLQTGGIPESIVDEAERDAVTPGLIEPTMLGRAATLADVGNAAAFAASDWAASMTGTSLNITAGTFAD